MTANILGQNKAFVNIDPRTKMILIIMTNVVMLTRPILSIEILILGLLTVLLLNHQKYASALKYLSIYLMCFLGDYLAEMYLSGTVEILVLTVVRMLRLYFPILLSFVYLMTTSTVSEFVAAFRKLHIPDVIIIPFSVMFRFFPTLHETMQQIIGAMKFRGLKFNFWTILTKPVMTLEYVLVPLLMSTVKIANDLSAASLSRGLAVGVNRTCTYQIKFSIADVLVTLLCIGLITINFMD